MTSLEKLEVAPPSPGQLRHGKRRIFVECGSVLVRSVLELLHLFPSSAGLSSLLLYGVSRKPKQAPADMVLPLFHNISAGECASFSESRTESPNEIVLFKASSTHCVCKMSSVDAAVPCEEF